MLSGCVWGNVAGLWGGGLFAAMKWRRDCYEGRGTGCAV
jgi:hypothetical protein